MVKAKKSKVGVGPALLRLRERSGLTNKELGKLLGISESAASRHQAEDANPQWDTVVRVLDALECTFQDLADELSALNAPRKRRLDDMAEIHRRLEALERLMGETVSDPFEELSPAAKRLFSGTATSGGKKPSGSSSL